MNTEEQLQLDPGWLIHKPIRGPRSGHIGEEVFAERWVELMLTPTVDGDDRPNAMLMEILSQYPKVVLEQREVTVSATFICWLGCTLELRS